MPEFKNLDEISESFKQYLILNYEILKLQATERTSVIGSSSISLLIVGISVFMFIFFLSIGAGFYISALMNNTYSGFIIIAGLYFLLSLALLLGRKKMIEKLQN